MKTRKLPLTLLLIMVITSTVSFLPVQEARALVELAYDSGTPEWNNFAPFVGVRFSLPAGISSARLVTIRFGWFGIEAPGFLVTIHVMATDLVTELTTPIPTTGGSGGFTDLDVSSRGIMVLGDFYVVLESISGGNHQTDDVPNVGRSFRGDTPSTMTLTEFNLLLRVLIDSNMAPVGGVVLPTNTLAILAPYVALAGLIAVVSAVVVVKRKRD